MKLELKNVNKVYKGKSKEDEVHALCNMNLRIGEGEKIIIIGESGAGKSTLLNAISLLDNDYIGNYTIEDKAVNSLNEKDMAYFRNQIFSYIFQSYALIDDDTVYENVGIPLLYSNKFKRKQRSERIKEILQKVHLDKEIYKKVKNLSGGQRQRVAIARALVNMPEILMLDEPTGALNRTMSDSIMNYIYEYINENNKIMILVTHDIEKVKKGTCRVIEMKMGEIVSDSVY